MSAQQEENGAPVCRPDGDASPNDNVRAGSLSLNRVSAHKVYAMHGLLLSGIELALTVSNAVNQGAFQLNSFSDVIFGGSVVIEAVGFAFAIAMALRILLYPVAQGVIGVGVPAMVIVQALVVEGSVKGMLILCFVGLGAQSVCFLLFAVIAWFESPDSVPTVSVVAWIVAAVVCAFFFYACHKRNQDGHSTTEVFYSILMAVPFVVEIAESTLLFTSGTIPFVAYLLAVLDLVIIAPAASFIFVSVAIFLMQLLNGD